MSPTLFIELSSPGGGNRQWTGPNSRERRASVTRNPADPIQYLGLVSDSARRNDRPMIPRLKSGRHPPSLPTLERLADALDADPTVRLTARAS
jgi:hypothetical protein